MVHEREREKEREKETYHRTRRFEIAIRLPLATAVKSIWYILPVVLGSPLLDLVGNMMILLLLMLSFLFVAVVALVNYLMMSFLTSFRKFSIYIFVPDNIYVRKLMSPPVVGKLSEV